MKGKQFFGLIVGVVAVSAIGFFGYQQFPGSDVYGNTDARSGRQGGRGGCVGAGLCGATAQQRTGVSSGRARE